MRMIRVLAVVACGCGDSNPSAPDAAADADAPEIDARVYTPIPNDTFRISLSPGPWATAMFAAGIQYTDGQETASTPAELIGLFASHGANEVYARVNTRNAWSAGPDSRLTTALERAQQATAAGMPLNIELGLFRTYGEITCQTPPDFSDYPAIQDFFPPSKTGWHELTLAEMKDLLARYGLLVASAVKNTGVTVNVWDLGNEVDFGTAGVAPPPFPGNPCDGEEGSSDWYAAPDTLDPDIGQTSALTLATMPEPDRIAWLQANIWPYEAQLLAATASGIRAVFPDAKVATHLSGAFLTPTWVTAFYDAMAANGFVVDEYAFSYYPTAADDPDVKLANVKAIVAGLRAKDPARGVFIAEFGYPSAAPTGPYATWNHPPSGYALTEADQYRFLFELASWGRAGGLDGIRPFAPELLLGWEPFASFRAERSGARAKPVIDAVWYGASAPDPSAL